jgi:hypothetical protein
MPGCDGKNRRKMRIFAKGRFPPFNKMRPGTVFSTVIPFATGVKRTAHGIPAFFVRRPF